MFAVDEEDKFTFGRNNARDLMMKGAEHNIEKVFAFISSKHFTIRKYHKDDGEFSYIVDNSTNGTCVNGKRMEPAPNGKRPLLLNNGDRISLCSADGPCMKIKPVEAFEI